MSSASVPVRALSRIPFEAPVTLQQSEDTNKPKPRGDIRLLQETYSSLTKIRNCGHVPLPRTRPNAPLRFNHCDHWLCARCGSKQQRKAANKARQIATEQGTVLLWTATLARDPSASLSQAWDDAEGVWKKVTYGQWLARRVDGYRRFVGVSHGPNGWGVHFHTILVSRNELGRTDARAIAMEINQRWLRAADMRSLAADPSAQHVSLVPHERVPAAVHYSSHQAWGHPGHPAGTPESIIRDALAGDVDALELMHELERAGHNRRPAQGGILR